MYEHPEVEGLEVVIMLGCAAIVEKRRTKGCKKFA